MDVAREGGSDLGGNGDEVSVGNEGYVLTVAWGGEATGLTFRTVCQL